MRNPYVFSQIVDLLNKTTFQDVKNQSISGELLLFNNINLNQNELQKAVMHPLANPPADPKQGQMYFNTGNKKLYYYDDIAVSFDYTIHS